MPEFPSFSAVVEWENARLAGTGRATAMLREFFCQIAELQSVTAVPVELIVLYEEDAVAREIVEAAVVAACPAGRPPEVRLHATRGSSYYGQKNIGARLASRDYLLFIDSDVIPEPGWLRALLGSLGPGVKVVGGNTYVDPATFLGRAFGQFWFFPPRSTESGLSESPFFYANNVIFRRDLFLAYEFSDLPLYRGQCAALATRLRQNGVRVYLRSDARVSHAPPAPGRFLHRALCEGHDLAVRARFAGQPDALGGREFLRQFRQIRDRVNERRKLSRSGPIEDAGALALASAYAVLRFIGHQWTILSPALPGKILGITRGDRVSSLPQLR